ncbi:hypothetical protein HPB50_014859 [Hyalomma asiaticum]|uniref:Uncharacterized protein n=1 Tax=Hyalomma asiaticum TaxID=266040 RepID=A0ACB7SVL9_HYAAI|nr:hypothetical protein HPB50_014859 [Hyalomma asiaticum]
MRGKKWYSSLFTCLLDTSVDNAPQLYKLRNGSTEHGSLRRSMAVAYLKKYESKASRVKCHQFTIQGENRFDRNDHIMPQSKQTRCAHCHKKKTTRCEKCNVGLQWTATHTFRDKRVAPVCRRDGSSQDSDPPTIQT